MSDRDRYGRGRGGPRSSEYGRGRGFSGAPRGPPRMSDDYRPHDNGDRQFYGGPPPSAMRGRGGPRGPMRDDRGYGPPRGAYQHGGPRGEMPPPQFAPPGRGRGGGGPPRGGPGFPRQLTHDDQPSPDTLLKDFHWPQESETPGGRSEFEQGSRSHEPSEQGDVISPASSTEALSDVARQKKRHPINVGVDLAGAMSKLHMQRTVRIPSRPDQGGRSGTPIEVTANCWDLSVQSREVLMYFVEVIAVYRHEKESSQKTEIRMPPKEKRALIQQIVNALPPETIYDGGHTVYSEKPIPGVTKDGVQKQIEIKDPLNRDRLLLEYRIMEVQTVSTGDVQNFIRNEKATSLDMPQDSIRLLDCVLKTICKGSFVSLGRAALFYEKPLKVVSDKLFTIHKGFITSVRPQWKVRVNIDMTCKAYFTSGNLADVMYEKYGDGMSKCGRQMAIDLKRIRVETQPFYVNEKGEHYSRRFTVHGFSAEPAASLKIEDINQTVEEYFLKHHKIKLKYPELPCVKVNQSRDVFLPMELLNILPYQPPNAKKSDIASEVIRCAAIRPQDRFRELQEFVNRVVESTHPLVKEFAVKIIPRPVVTAARVLDTPKASFGREPIVLERGKWRPPAFYQPASSQGGIKWAILSIPGDRNAPRHQQMLAERLPSTARQFNIQMGRPECAIIQRAELLSHFERFLKQGINFVLLVLYDDFNYPTIKRTGDLLTGMRTQCVRGRTLDKPNVIPNLLYKINGKLGGTNWQIRDILRDDKELLMVFGADVTHPAPTQTQQVRQSIAAVLGSITPDLMRYAVVVRQQATTEKGNKTTREIIDAMESIVTELLKVSCLSFTHCFKGVLSQF
ncbi:unnamed protein product [Calicophoron daubneyi]|uniref:Uncharacterized protein n=1 Tax=Calicophoron daubneyi TaxID=300641 RepID=A0AAV2TXQ6_CALDB